MFLLLQSTHRMLVRYHPTIGQPSVPNLRARVPGETGAITREWVPGPLDETVSESVYVMF